MDCSAERYRSVAVQNSKTAKQCLRKVQTFFFFDKDLLKAIKHDGLKMTKKHVTALFEQFGQEGMLTL